ncbi:MAG: conserved phage C-terminal domain-containing protein [Gammaproteobacteria bacterium]
MRIYGAIQICFWEKPETQQLSDEGKLLAIYLLTGPHSNMVGCFRLPDGYITEDLRWDMQKVKDAFNELSSIEFLTRDENSGWLVVHNFLKWNPVQNPRQGIGIQKLFDVVPTNSAVFEPLVKGLLMHGKYFDSRFLESLLILNKNCVNPIDTHDEKYLTDKDTDQDKDQNNINICVSDSADRSRAIEVLHFLNEKTGRVYRPVDINLKLIIARLKSGATVSECYQVIAKKTREWKSNPQMAEYLRPATLFNAIKFEQYVGELVVSTSGDEK